VNPNANPSRTLTKAEYQAIRRGYRLARRKDADYREGIRTARNSLSGHPQHAASYLFRHGPELSATFFKPVDMGRGNYRLPRGPRAEALFQRRDRYGRYAGMNLATRVDFRRTLRGLGLLGRAA